MEQYVRASISPILLFLFVTEADGVQDEDAPFRALTNVAVEHDSPFEQLVPFQRRSVVAPKDEKDENPLRSDLRSRTHPLVSYDPRHDVINHDIDRDQRDYAAKHDAKKRLRLALKAVASRIVRRTFMQHFCGEPRSPDVSGRDSVCTVFVHIRIYRLLDVPPQ